MFRLHFIVHMAEPSVFPLADSTDVFVFWLSDGPGSVAPDITKCLIDRDRLVWQKQPELYIPTPDVRLVHAGRFNMLRRRAPIWSVTVDTTTGHYSFWPVNPMMPYALATYNYDEACAFRDVLVALRQHRKPDYDRNPYVRQQVAKHKKRIRTDLDANVSPLVYWEQRKLWSLPPMWTVLVILGGTIAGIGVMMAIVLIVSIVVGWLSK